MLSVVCFKWLTPDYRTTFTAAHVNALAVVVRRHYPNPHRFICVTSEPAGIDQSIEIVPDRADYASLPSPHGGSAPSCYRRLRLWAPDAAATFGERIVNLDLDCVITGDLRPLWDRPDDVVLWQDPLYPAQRCGSMALLTAGSRPQVWADFDPKRSPALARAAGYRGSDQAWLSYCLRDEPVWTPADGVLSWRKLVNGALPTNARIVFFHGAQKSWHEPIASLPWVRASMAA